MLPVQRIDQGNGDPPPGNAEQIKDTAGNARFFIGAIAQRLEHPPVSRNVWGSNPHSLACY